MIECEGCEYYDKDEGYCTALICTPFSCDELLPCEETDAVTLYAEGSMYAKSEHCLFTDPFNGDPC